MSNFEVTFKKQTGMTHTPNFGSSGSFRLLTARYLYVDDIDFLKMRNDGTNIFETAYVTFD